MLGHHFISYSTVDGKKIAQQLYDSLMADGIPVWMDKPELHAGLDWDSQLAQAIQTCKTVLFLMTPDSVDDLCTCKQEYSFALSYKKPIVPLLCHRDTKLPFRLQPRQYIDFTGDFKTALAKFRLYLQWLDSPDGELHALQDRLADANRDLRRTTDATDRARIEDDIAQLKKQIAEQEKIVADPAAAAKRTEQSIERAIERERAPEKPISGKSKTKFINQPPGIAPSYYQDRYEENKLIKKFLLDESQRLITVVGRAGIGKTAMVCRLLKSLESGRLPDDLGDLPVDGIVYLSAVGTRIVNVPNLFADLCQLLPDEKSHDLDALYKNPQVATEAKINALLAEFPHGRFIVLLDNFENVLDAETMNIRDAELNEALRALLNAPHHAVKVMITTRIAPHDLGFVHPGRQNRLNLDNGLEPQYAKNVLTENDADGTLGLKNAPDDLLTRACEFTRGFPRALEALIAILRADRYTTLAEILANAIPPDKVVEALVGEAFNRLDPNAQRVMQALAVYNRPVTPAAVDYLLQPCAASVDSAPVLNRLVTMQLVRKDGMQYRLHQTDCAYALGRVARGEIADGKDAFEEYQRRVAKLAEENSEPINAMQEFFSQRPDVAKILASITPENMMQVFAENPQVVQAFQEFASQHPEAIQLFMNAAQSSGLQVGTQQQPELRFTQYALLHRAADYFAQTRKPREAWKTLADLEPQLNEFDLRCAAEDYDTAASVLLEIDFHYLLLWGHYRLMIEMHERLQGKISEKLPRIQSLNNRGEAFRSMGQVQKAIDCYESALPVARELENKQAEGALLGNLGNAYSDLGETRRAIQFYEQALAIAREIGDKRGEGNRLGNLGLAYSDLGETRRAIQFYEQALAIAREIGDKRGEGNHLGNLGNAYSDLGETRRAITFYEQALAIAREIGDKRGEGNDLGNLGKAYNEMGDARRAITFYEQALAIAREIGDKQGEGVNCSQLGSAYSFIGELGQASKYFERGIEIARETGYRYGEAFRLFNLANIFIDANRLSEAIQRSNESAAIGQEIESPIICHHVNDTLALAHLYAGNLPAARTAAETARKYDVPQNNHNVAVLLGIIALRQNDVAAAQETFTAAIQHADKILALTPEYYDALDAKGVALCGLALIDPKGFENPSGLAVETFHAARKINKDKGIVNRVVRLIDALALAHPNGAELLAEPRQAAEG